MGPGDTGATYRAQSEISRNENRGLEFATLYSSWLFYHRRNDLKTPLCHSELVSESPIDGNRLDEILRSRIKSGTGFRMTPSFMVWDRFIEALGLMRASQPAIGVLRLSSVWVCGRVF